MRLTQFPNGGVGSTIASFVLLLRFVEFSLLGFSIFQVVLDLFNFLEHPLVDLILLCSRRIPMITISDQCKRLVDPLLKTSEITSKGSDSHFPFNLGHFAVIVKHLEFIEVQVP